MILEFSHLPTHEPIGSILARNLADAPNTWRSPTPSTTS